MKVMHGKVIKRTFALIVMFLMLATPLCAQKINEDYLEEYIKTSDYSQGLFAGERNATGNSSWFFAGVIFGPLGVAAAYVVKPNPPGHSLMGKHLDYVLGYTEGYRNKSRGKNTLYAFRGLLFSVVVVTLWLTAD